MDERIGRIMAEVSAEELARVAGGALGLPDAHLDGPPVFTELKRPHAEDRTIGIVRATGRADGREWSSVVKLVDLSIPAPERVIGLTWPENEEHVYERRLFADEGLSFRPARCYAVTRPADQLKLFWLEDLTAARGTPFTIDEVAQMARHLGQWDASHAGPLPDLGFPLGRDAYVRRSKGWNFPARLADLAKHRDHPLVRLTYPDGSTTVAHRLVSVLDRLLDRLLTAPHAFAFGDCSVGNVFHLPVETVAIDWASLTDDPVGVDGGCLVGSSLSWGPDFMDAVRAEREMWLSYVDGLRSGGWHADDRDLRRAALAHIASYFVVMLITPSLLAPGNTWFHEFVEGRFGLPVEEVCARLANLVPVIPRYLDELEHLLER